MFLIILGIINFALGQTLIYNATDWATILGGMICCIVAGWCFGRGLAELTS